MSTLKYLVIHCTATQGGKSVTSQQIRDWHTKPASEGGRGWKQVGYTDIFHINGGVERLVQNNEDGVVDPWEITNGATGINSMSRHVVYVGGIDMKGKPCDTRNQAQLEAMKRYVLEFVRKNPTIKVAGHNQFAPKACPSFDVATWLKSIGVSETNIHIK